MVLNQYGGCQHDNNVCQCCHYKNKMADKMVALIIEFVLLLDIRQERSSQLRPAAIHPAFRERGRAIPEAAESLPVRRTAPPPRIIEGRVCVNLNLAAIYKDN